MGKSFTGYSRTSISGAAASQMLILDAPGTGFHNRIYKIVLTSNATVDLLLSNDLGTYYTVAGSTVVLDYGELGTVGTVGNTALGVTSSGAANVGTDILYCVEAD